MNQTDNNRRSSIIHKFGTTALMMVISVILLPDERALAVRGGDFELSWSTIDGGGGTSSGDEFVLTGTIGQADAAYSTGEIFELYGGFWPGQMATCWDARVCAGQPHGDATCEGTVNFADLFALKAYFGRCSPWADSECCVDFTQDGCINFGDLFVLKTGFGTWDYSPSTSNQNCPP